MERLYVLVRRDLSPEQQAVQAGHAVGAWCRAHPRWQNEVLVYLHVAGEPELLEAAAQLRAMGDQAVIFREPDRADEATALAVCDPRLKSLVKRLPLLSLSA